MAEEDVFIVDIGSTNTKAGFSGEDVPCYILPSKVPKSNKPNSELTEAILKDKKSLSTHAPIVRGKIVDWDAMESYWNYIMDSTIMPPLNYTNNSSILSSAGLSSGININTNLSHTSVASSSNISSNTCQFDNLSLCIVTSLRWTNDDKSNLATIAFDRYPSLNSISFVNSATCSIMASGRTSGLCIENGGELLQIAPVFEGLPLAHAVVLNELGGEDISLNLKRILNDKGYQVNIEDVHLIKEKFAYINTGGVSASNNDMINFFLPDGQEVKIENKYLRDCSEILFSSSSSSAAASAASVSSASTSSAALASGLTTSIGLVNQTFESISLCDDSIRSDLTNNIILSGGCTLLNGYGDRLHKDLVAKFHVDNKLSPLARQVRVVPTSYYRERGYTYQRKNAAWIGGSIISSFSPYHQSIKVSKQEWEDHGATIFAVKSI